MKQLTMNLVPGDIIYLHKYRQLSRQQMCKVLSVRKLDTEPVKVKTLQYNRITRSGRLIIVEDLYERLTYSVYDAFAWGYKANLWDRFLYWLASKWD